MQDAIPEMYEDVNDVLREAVRQLGGHKKVGPVLWPELSPDQAANRIRDCLNPDRREKLSPEQFLLLMRMSQTGGFHAVMSFVAMQAGYETPRPITPEDQEADLQRQFINAVEGLQKIQSQMQRVQGLRRVG